MRHGKLAVGLGVLLLAILAFAACGPEAMPVLETVVAKMAVSPTAELRPVATVVVEALSPWDDPYKEAPPDLCPPDKVCEGQLGFAEADPVRERYAGREVWVRRGVFKNAQGEAFGMDVIGLSPEAVKLYTENVKVCLDQVFTGRVTVGRPPEPGFDQLPKDFGANPEDVSIEIYLLGPGESKQDYAIDFVIDPTVSDWGTHHYEQKYATRGYANVSVAGSQGEGSVGAELFRNAASVGATHVAKGSAQESDELSLDGGAAGAWWDLVVRGEDEGTYRVSGRYDYPASWDYEYRDLGPCAPPDICLKLSPGQSATHTINYTTAGQPIPNLDVLLLFDVTGSMPAIAEVRDHASEIMNTVKDKVPSAAFGVASFSDYPGEYEYAGYTATYGASIDYPWYLDQDITTDTGAVQRSLDSLQTLNGEDFPESYSRALFEAVSVSWRDGAKKVVVLFGDSVPHDPEFDTGVDPGEDWKAGTEDDLAYADVVKRLQEQQVEVIPINSVRAGFDPDLNAKAASFFESLALATGGQVVSLARAEDAPQAVLTGLEEAMARINWLTIVPDHLTFGRGAAVAPSAYERVGGGETLSFEVTIAVPEGTLPGRYEFDLTVVGDGVPLEVHHVVVDVGS